MKRIRVLLRLWLRDVVRLLTGRRFSTVLLPDRHAAMMEASRPYIRAAIELPSERRVDNRGLLTGMVVALLHGPNTYPWSGWEQYKYAAQRRSNFRGVPYKLVGIPAVYKDSSGVKIGLTDWSNDYTSRDETLAPRRARRAFRRKT